MIKLELIAARDGIAVVLDGEHGGSFLVRPPYEKGHFLSVSSESHRRLIEMEGFEPADRAFASWSDLISFLRTRVIETNAADKNELISLSPTLLERAPASVIEDLLRRVTEELIPQSKTRIAAEVIERLIKSPAMATRPDLQRRATELALSAAKSSIARHDIDIVAVDSNAMEKAFPLSTAQYGAKEVIKFVSAVKNGGSLLVSAAP